MLLGAKLPHSLVNEVAVLASRAKPLGIDSGAHLTASLNNVLACVVPLMTHAPSVGPALPCFRIASGIFGMSEMTSSR